MANTKSSHGHQLNIELISAYQMVSFIHDVLFLEDKIILHNKGNIYSVCIMSTSTYRVAIINLNYPRPTILLKLYVSSVRAWHNEAILSDMNMETWSTNGIPGILRADQSEARKRTTRHHQSLNVNLSYCWPLSTSGSGSAGSHYWIIYGTELVCISHWFNPC